VNAALSTGEKKEICIIVPADLIHFKLELLLGTWLVRLDVNECHQIFLVADGDCLTIRRPAHIDVLSYTSIIVRKSKYVVKTETISIFKSHINWECAT